MNKNSRNKAFDLARGIALILMVFIHILDEFATPEFKDSLQPISIYLIGCLLAAPVFIFTMGVFFQISDKSTVKKSVIRGGKLISQGYLLNFIRFSLPIYLALKLEIFSLESITPDTPSSLFFAIDILQFAGLAIIAMAIIKKYFKHPLMYIILALPIMFFSYLLWNTMSSNSLVNFFL